MKNPAQLLYYCYQVLLIVKELSTKDYSSYIRPPKVRMDYVIMFVPHTGALWTALNAQPDLWRKAMDRNVFIADEQTLFAALRIINLTWTQIAQAQNHDIWRAAAPDIDMLCPDIYLPEFPDILRMYSRAGNPVFIPESRAGQNGAANAAFAIGEMGAIGYSPFGFENGALSAANETFNSFYHKAGSAADIILEAQASGNIRAAWVKGSDPAVYKQTLELGDYKIGVELVSSGMRNGGAPQLTGGTYSPDASGYAIAIRESDDSFLFLGSNVRITFLPADGQGTIGLAKVTEGDFRNGEWVEGRWLNGDQIQLRYDVLYAVDEGYSGQGLNFGTPEPGFIKVQLYKY